MKNLLQLPFLFFIIFNFFHCQKKKKPSDSYSEEAYQNKEVLVKAAILKKAPFFTEILSNGKLEAVRKSQLKFDVTEKIAHIYVQEGQEVSAGTPIASLRQAVFLSEQSIAKNNFEKVSLEYQDQLMMMGVDSLDQSDAPLLDMIAIRSGLVIAKLELARANDQFSSSVLKAPFKGRIANLNRKKHEYASTSEIFCTLIDDDIFEVTFYILENEYHQVQLGDILTVMPYGSDQTYPGIISSINPEIDKNGMVKIRGRVSNKDRSLVEGMNVKVVIRKAVPNKIVVPKEAVLLRQNREMVFRYANGLARWVYVIIDQENSTSYSLSVVANQPEKIALGDTVIVTGNLNLAHESEVKLTEVIE